MSVKKNLLFIMSLTLFISNIIYIPRATAKAALSIDSKTPFLSRTTAAESYTKKTRIRK